MKNTRRQKTPGLNLTLIASPGKIFRNKIECLSECNMNWDLPICFFKSHISKCLNTLASKTTPNFWWYGPILVPIEDAGKAMGFGVAWDLRTWVGNYFQIALCFWIFSCIYLAVHGSQISSPSNHEIWISRKFWNKACPNLTWQCCFFFFI